MQSGSTRFWSWVLTGTLTVLLAVAVNLFLDVFDGQWDLTEDDRYTLPDEAREIAASLEDKCRIQAIISDPLPSYLGHLPSALKTRLEEFRDASDGLIEFEFIAPEEDEELREELEDREIKPVGLRDFLQGKQVTGSYYMWLVFQYADQEETLHLLELRQALFTESDLLRLLPFQIASRLVKMMHPDRQVGILSEKRMPPQQLKQVFGQQETDSLSSLRNEIESHLTKPRDVQLKAGNRVPEDIDSLIVYRPDGLDERAVYEIDQALMKGRSVVLLLDNFATVDVDRLATDYVQAMRSGELKVRPVQHGLTDWLAHFGVVVGEGYVESEECCRSVQRTLELTRAGPKRRDITRRFPGMVRVLETDEKGDPTGLFNEDSPALSGLGVVSMAWPVPMHLDESAGGEHPGMTAEVIVRTVDDSYVRLLEQETIDLWQDEGEDPDIPTDRSSYDLAVSLHGHFKSYFAGRTYGEGEDASDRPPRRSADGKALPPLPNEEPKLEESVEPGQLWVFADSDFANDLTYMRLQRLQGPANWSQQALQGLRNSLAGLVNVVDSLTVGDELIAIRKPSLTDRSLDETEVEEDKGSIRWWTVGFAPVLLITLGLVWGIVRWVWTRVPTPSLPLPSDEGVARSQEQAS